MMKYFRNAGYVQIYIGKGLFLGFAVTAFGGWLYSAFFMGTLLLAGVYLTIKDTAGISKRDPDKPFAQLVRPVAMFYGSIYSVLVFAFLIGLFCGSL